MDDRHKTGNSKQLSKSKQQYVRAQGLLNFQRETCMTPYGIRSVRLHQSTDTANVMEKYRSRPNTAIGLFHSQPTDANPKRPRTPVPPAKDRSPVNENRPSSGRSLIYNTRNSLCSPPDLYRNDELRSAAKESQGRKSRSFSDTSSSCSFSSKTSTDLYFQTRTPRSDIAYRFGKPVQRPKFVQRNKFLNHNDLTMGQKQYIWGIARIYSVDQLKLLKQRQYHETLEYEYMKRVITKNLNETQRIKLWKEYQMYEDFIDRYTKGLPMSQQNSQMKGRNSIPHRHSCIPWLSDSVEPKILKDRIILHDPQSHPAGSIENMLSERKPSPRRSRSAPPEPYRGAEEGAGCQFQPNSTSDPVASNTQDEDLNETYDPTIFHPTENTDKDHSNHGSLVAETYQKLTLQDPEDNFL